MLGIFKRRRFTGTKLFIQLDHRFFTIGRAVFFQCCLHGFNNFGPVFRMVLDLGIAKEFQDFFIGFHTHSPKQHSDRHLTCPVHTRIDYMVQIRFEFNPRTAIRDNRCSI